MINKMQIEVGGWILFEPLLEGRDFVCSFIFVWLLSEQLIG